MPRAFLTAEWRNLIMLNYAVEPFLLRPYVPRGTELDSWGGTTYISLVGFLFVNTRLLRVPVPAHRNFEEVNLRFYVRRESGGELRRGVTFVREIVPRAAIAIVARLAYNEPYVALPMRHRFTDVSAAGVPASVAYGWKSAFGWTDISAAPCGIGQPAETGSREEFMTEHYWGYTRQRDGSTLEYRVDHPSWRVWEVNTPQISGNLAEQYGRDFAHILSAPPASAFLADGSRVTVYRPDRLCR